MDSQLPQAPAPKRGGIPLWVAVFGALVLLIAASAVLAAILYTSNNKVRIAEAKAQAFAAETQERKLAEQKAAEEARLTSARNRQEEVLHQVRALTNSLAQLALAVQNVRTNAAALQTDDTGRRVALHPGLVRLARQVYDVNLPTLPAEADVNLRLEAARRLELQIVDTANTAHVPTPEQTDEVGQLAAWGGDQARKAEELKTLLRNLVQESTVRVTTATLTADSPTLEAAIQRLNQTELAAQQQVAAATTEDARNTAAQTRLEAEREKILADARNEADRIRAEANEAAGQLQREMKLRAATNQIETARAQVATQNAAEEARKIQLRQKASEPKVRSLLAPFTTPGTLQVVGRNFGRATPPKPLSWSQLRAFGALDTDLRGQQRLVDIATNNDDKDRPRLSLHPKFWPRHASDVTTVTDIQNLLNELGPVLVEMNLLQP